MVLRRWHFTEGCGIYPRWAAAATRLREQSCTSVQQVICPCRACCQCANECRCITTVHCRHGEHIIQPSPFNVGLDVQSRHQRCWYAAKAPITIRSTAKGCQRNRWTHSRSWILLAAHFVWFTVLLPGFGKWRCRYHIPNTKTSQGHRHQSYAHHQWGQDCRGAAGSGIVGSESKRRD